MCLTAMKRCKAAAAATRTQIDNAGQKALICNPAMPFKGGVDMDGMRQSAATAQVC